MYKLIGDRLLKNGNNLEYRIVKIETNKAVVRQFIEAINQQDFVRLDALVSSEVIRHGAPPAKYLQGLTKLGSSRLAVIIY